MDKSCPLKVQSSREERSAPMYSHIFAPCLCKVEMMLRDAMQCRVFIVELGLECLLTMALFITWMVTPRTIQRLRVWPLPSLPFMFSSLCFLPSEPCMQPLNPGDCNDTSVRWYFDMQEYICKPFKYTGCLGNSNNFFNKKECVEACLFTGKTNILGNLRA